MKIMIGMGLCVLSLALFCVAAEKDPLKGLMPVDSNGDGQIDEKEISAEVARVAFAGADQDGDGYISLEEWKTADQDKSAQQRFTSIDTNKDGRIDRLEFEDFVKEDFTQRKLFENLDADRSGYLTSDELARKPGFSLFGVRF